jgi:hypothetical protein
MHHQRGVLPADIRSPLVKRLVLASVVAVAAAAGLGCPAAPRQRPVKGADVSTDTGSLESVRRQLQGKWELVALETVPPSGGTKRVPIKATGTLTYDEFSNLTIDAHTTDPNAPVAARERALLSFQGRAVIDVVRHELKLADVTGNVDPNEVLSPERRRRYEITLDSLKLSSVDAKGQVTAISTWHRLKE